MNKAELVDAIADKSGIAKSTVDEVIKAMTETIEAEVAKGDKISIPGFISFQKVKRAARTGRNPRTGEAVEVEEKWVPFFKTGKELREKLNAEK
jgi:integration host factor subunit beta